MGVNVAVPQPLLDVLERYTIGIEERCAGVPQIMEADTPHWEKKMMVCCSDDSEKRKRTSF